MRAQWKAAASLKKALPRARERAGIASAPAGRRQPVRALPSATPCCCGSTCPSRACHRRHPGSHSDAHRDRSPYRGKNATACDLFQFVFGEIREVFKPVVGNLFPEGHQIVPGPVQAQAPGVTYMFLDIRYSDRLRRGEQIRIGCATTRVFLEILQAHVASLPRLSPVHIRVRFELGTNPSHKTCCVSIILVNDQQSMKPSSPIL